MTGAEKCGAFFAAGFANELDRIRCVLWVEAGSRFISQHEAWSGCKRPSYCDALLLPDTESVWSRVWSVDSESL